MYKEAVVLILNESGCTMAASKALHLILFTKTIQKHLGFMEQRAYLLRGGKSPNLFFNLRKGLNK